MPSFFSKLLFLLIVSLFWPMASLAQEKRPVIFVPGITGSVLSTDSGEVIWGNASSLSATNFAKLNLLPEGSPPVALQPVDALRDVPLIFGAIQVGLYSKLIDFLTGKVSFFEAVTGNPLRGDYVEGEDLFVFSYDWRRSNFANAKALNDFIVANVPEGEFDIIAHSMGGLVTRIMLSGQKPHTLCTQPGQVPAALTDDDYQAMCTAIYGSVSDTPWPTDVLGGPYSAAPRLHTFIEIAVPHYGSANLAATLLDAWGGLSQKLLGGKRAIQDTVLSMTAPVELLPTYDKCCARGTSGQTGNIEIDPYDSTYWLNLVLAFGQSPCPYQGCATKREIFVNGIENRKIIDGIMDAGLPSTVRANHGIVGRNVKNTKEVMYVAFGATGDGDGVTYRTNSEGDGTVHRISALLPKNTQTTTFTNFTPVMRTSHPFIIGNETATTYIYNMLVNPIDSPIQAVSANTFAFADGIIDELAFTVEPQIVISGQPFDVVLQVKQEDGSPFVIDQARATEVELALAAIGADDSVVLDPRLTYNDARSFGSSGNLHYNAEGITAPAPGIYTLSLRTENGTLTEQYLYVLEN